MGYWKLTFVNNEIIEDKRCNHCSHGEKEILLQETIIKTEEITKGKWWWKKKITNEEKEKITLYIIPTREVRKIEWISEDTNGE